MKKTWKEKTVSKLFAQSKKHKILKAPMIVIITIIVCVCKSINFLNMNIKRMISISFAILCFAVSSSFCAPVLLDNSLCENAPEFLTPEDVALADGVLEKDIIIDDNDVIDGYEDSDLYNSQDIDTYTIDEILDENKELIKDNEKSDNLDVQSFEDYQFDSEDWRYVLINKQHPVPEDYTFTLGTIKGSMKCDARILDELLGMLQGAREDGVNLIICSPYRDFHRQQVLFDRKINAYLKMGYTYLDAFKSSSQSVTVPGASEHQIGLAFDFVCDTYNILNDGFGETSAGKWLSKHSYEYGFILRYPSGKESITGIGYEPWHFRYVGKEAATVMKENELTLEEFVDTYLKN
ncbi:MAG TPA: M15 family metallopeptidase [Lachnospiraceae bacterium]|nr:M15 family metallopeptidase [Lachnospiraceae bacterium]